MVINGKHLCLRCANTKDTVVNCRYDMSKGCYPELCTCDEDITDVTDYSGLLQAASECEK